MSARLIEVFTTFENLTDGKLYIASFGYTATEVGNSGPPAVYVWCRP